MSRFQFYYLLKFFKDTWNAFEVKKKKNEMVHFELTVLLKRKASVSWLGIVFYFYSYKFVLYLSFFLSCLRFFYLILKVISLDKLQTCFALKISCIHHLSQKILIPSLVYFFLVTQKVSNKTSETKSHKKLPHFRQNAQQKCMQNRRCFLCYL